MNLNHSVSLNGSASSTSPSHRHGSSGDGSLCVAFIRTALFGSQWPISSREPKTKTSTSEDSGVRMTPNLNNMITDLKSTASRCLKNNGLFWRVQRFGSKKRSHSVRMSGYLKLIVLVEIQILQTLSSEVIIPQVNKAQMNQDNFIK